MEVGGRPSRPAKLEVSAPVGFFERRRRLKGLKKFYEEQDRLLELYEEDEKKLLANDAEESREANDREYKRKLKWDRRLAVVVSSFYSPTNRSILSIFAVNLAILAGNLAASILSGSYSVISAFVDSMMDVVSSLVVQLTVWAINHTNDYKYPRGRERLEVIGVLSTSILMFAANAMMVIQSVEAIISHNIDPNANLPTLCILGAGIVAKVLMMLACWKHGSSNTRVLALDMRNDLATNIVALLCAFVGDRYWVYADPVGAIVICTCIAASWFWNALNQIPTVVGRRADHEYERRIQAIALKHDPRIVALDHVLLFHIGEKALVELHVVLNEELTLRVTHDICESLQQKVASLDFVDRCYVHVDYWCDGQLDGK